MRDNGGVPPRPPVHGYARTTMAERMVLIVKNQKTRGSISSKKEEWTAATCEALSLKIAAQKLVEPRGLIGLRTRVIDPAQVQQYLHL